MTTRLSMLVIYDSPRDAPGFYIVRETIVSPDGRLFIAHFAARFRTLKQARRYASPCRDRMPRWADDDPVIVETWL